MDTAEEKGIGAWETKTKLQCVKTKCLKKHCVTEYGWFHMSSQGGPTNIADNFCHKTKFVEIIHAYSYTY
jgi:hypothetical protein